MVASNQQCAVLGWALRAACTLVTRFTAIAISSSLGIVKFRLAEVPSFYIRFCMVNGQGLLCSSAIKKYRTNSNFQINST